MVVDQVVEREVGRHVEVRLALLVSAATARRDRRPPDALADAAPGREPRPPDGECDERGVLQRGDLRPGHVEQRYRP